MIDEESGTIRNELGEGLYDGQKRTLIAELAYSYAAERGFAGGDPIEDWLRAERSLAASLAGEQVTSRNAPLPERSQAASGAR